MPELQPDDEMVREVIKHTDAPNDTSLGRRLAIQILYELDVTSHPIGTVIASQLENYQGTINSRARNSMRRFVMGVMNNRGELDAIIQKYAAEFPLEQLAIIDRNILRLAVLEFALMERTPVGVAIDEAIELAKLFGSDGSSRFVNGVLGSVAADTDTLKAAQADYVARGQAQKDGLLDEESETDVLEHDDDLAESD